MMGLATSRYRKLASIARDAMCSCHLTINPRSAMRHFKRLMSFVNIETLINAHSNMKIEYQENNNNKKEKKIYLSALNNWQ